MKNKNHTRAAVLTLIPVIAFAAAFVCIAIYRITGRPSEGTGSLLGTIGVAGCFLLPLPCLIISAVGTSFASRAQKEGEIRSRRFFVIGIIEIILTAVTIVGFFIYVICSLFTISMGV